MNFFKNLLHSMRENLTLLITALVIAIVTWFYISMTLYPAITNTYDDVELNIDTVSSSISDAGLSLISCDTQKVNVRIKGSRMQIGNLSSDNFVAKLNTDSISTPGSKRIPIDIICTDSDINFEVESVTPATANVVFDRFETKKLNIVPEIPNITFSEGRTVDNDAFVCEPDTINITGPSAQLDKIAKVCAVSNKKLKLDSSYSISSDEIKLYTDDGTNIDPEPFKFDSSNYMIDIPVLTQKNVGLSVGIGGAPSTFNPQSLKFILSADSITLASKSAQLSDFPNTFEVGSVPLNELDLGFKKSFTIDTGNYKNMSNLDQVTVTLDDSELSKKIFTISDFKLINAPDNYNFEVATKSLDVAVIGPSEIIDEITTGDMVANINLMNVDKLSEGENINIDVTVSFTKYDNVWAVPQSKALVTRTAVEDSSTETEKNT